MLYERLSEFIEHKMRMSHIYQPVMLITLLRNRGSCKEKDIAKAILNYDSSQIEYYKNITNNMVGRVLRNHDFVCRDRTKEVYNLIDFDTLNSNQINRLVELCEKRLSSFLEIRGKQIYDHRRKSSGYISGTIKYRVLKRAKFHCELCGISADKKALEVDHIIPRNKGGTDDISNFQALCYSCNAMKRDRDDTDFREIRESYKYREKGCCFCAVNTKRILDENELAYIIRDEYSVTPLHSLIIPKRHINTFFELGQAEINACMHLINKSKAEIEAMDDSVSGFNLGVNDGESAGQTIFHCHIHLIPRRYRDVDDPRGGIRHIIPGKGYY